MNETIGILLIFSAIIFFIIFLLETELTLKEKVGSMIVFEIFIALLVFGVYLLGE